MNLFLMALVTAQATPDRLANSMELDSPVDRFAQSAVDDFVAYLDNSGGLNVLDMRSWSLDSVSPSCAAKDIALFKEDDGTVTLYGACSDGSLAIFEVNEDGSLSVHEPGTVVLDETEGLLGVVAGQYELWAASDDTVGVGLHDYTPATETANVYGPYTTGLSGFEMLVVQADDLIIIHGGDNLTKVGMMTGAAVQNQENLSGRSFVDAASDGDNLLYLMDSGGAVVRFISSTNDYQVVLNESDGLETCSAIALQPQNEDAYIAVAESSANEIRLFPLDVSNSIVSDTPVVSFSADNVNALFATESTLFAGTATLDIYSAAPWVEITTVPAGVVANGETLSLDFVSDTPGDWEIRLGTESGTLLSSGTLNADTSVTVEFQVTVDFVEGDNRLVVLVDEGSQEGHDSVVVAANNPPDVVLLDETSVGFGDGEIVLNFEGIWDEDLVRYDIYTSEIEFSAEDFSTGGPESVLEIAAEPGASVSVIIPDLVNGTRYYVAVRAVDDSGKEGAMSAVISVIPEPAVGAASLAGDSGGCAGLSTTARDGLPLGVFSLMICLLFRRRKPVCSPRF
jgi:hypothetical protein